MAPPISRSQNLGPKKDDEKRRQEGKGINRRKKDGQEERPREREIESGEKGRQKDECASGQEEIARERAKGIEREK